MCVCGSVKNSTDSISNIRRTSVTKWDSGDIDEEMGRVSSGMRNDRIQEGYGGKRDTKKLV